LGLLGVLVIALLVGCTETDQSFLEYRRQGGFAGLDDHLVIQSDGAATLSRGSISTTFNLPPDIITNLKRELAAANFSDLKREYLPAQSGSDRFEYRLTYHGHTVRTQDGAVPAGLQPILDTLNQLIQQQGQQ
jgi:hypothetical protein